MITILLLLGIFYLSLHITQEILSIHHQFKARSIRKKLPYITELTLNNNKIEEAKVELKKIMEEIAEL